MGLVPCGALGGLDRGVHARGVRTIARDPQARARAVWAAPHGGVLSRGTSAHRVATRASCEKALADGTEQIVGGEDAFESPVADEHSTNPFGAHRASDFGDRCIRRDPDNLGSRNVAGGDRS